MGNAEAPLPTNDNAIKGIIFDLDGTLYKMRWYMKPLMTVFSCTSPLLLPAYMKIRKNFAGKDLLSGDSLVDTMAKSMAGNIRRNKKWIAEGFYKVFVPSLRFQRGSRPGLNSLLQEITQKNITIGVLSDFSCIPERLQILSIDQKFIAATLSSETVGALKPSPRPFLELASSMKIAPQSTLVIGDRKDTDGEGARTAGMRFIQISDNQKKDPEALSWVQLKEYLQQLPSIN